MSESSGARGRSLAPWAGLLVGAFAALAQHQVGSILGQDDCGSGNALISGLTGVVALVLALGGALPSLRTWRAAPSAPLDSTGDGSARFIAGVSLMASLLFVLLILVQTSGGFIIPGCAG